MPLLSADLRKLFAKTRLVVLPEDYFLIRLPPDVRPLPGEWYRPATTRFAVFVREPGEITLIVGRRKWLRMKRLFNKYSMGGPMKVICFNIELSLDVYGYIAALSRELAKAKIPIVPVSTFNRDHILVNKKDLPRAVRLLRRFLKSCGSKR